MAKRHHIYHSSYSDNYFLNFYKKRKKNGIVSASFRFVSYGERYRIKKMNFKKLNLNKHNVGDNIFSLKLSKDSTKVSFKSDYGYYSDYGGLTTRYNLHCRFVGNFSDFKETIIYIIDYLKNNVGTNYISVRFHHINLFGTYNKEQKIIKNIFIHFVEKFVYKRNIIIDGFPTEERFHINFKNIISKKSDKELLLLLNGLQHEIDKSSKKFSNRLLLFFKKIKGWLL